MLQGTVGCTVEQWFFGSSKCETMLSEFYLFFSYLLTEFLRCFFCVEFFMFSLCTCGFSLPTVQKNAS